MFLLQQGRGGLLHQLIELVGQFIPQQVVDDDIGLGHIHWQQGPLQMADVMVVDLLEQSMGKESLIQQRFQAPVCRQVFGRMQKVILGGVQERGCVIVEAHALAHRCHQSQASRYAVYVVGNELQQARRGSGFGEDEPASQVW